MRSIYVNNLSWLRTFLLVGLVQLSTVFSYAKNGDEVNKEKVMLVSAVAPLTGETFGHGNHIDWTAGIKEKIDFFIVQRSKDDKHFVPLAMIYKKNETHFSLFR